MSREDYVQEIADVTLTRDVPTLQSITLHVVTRKMWGEDNAADAHIWKLEINADPDGSLLVLTQRVT